MCWASSSTVHAGFAWSQNICAALASSSVPGQRSGCQSADRMKAFAQWRYTSSTSTPMASCGRLPMASMDASNASTRVMHARPFTRRVSRRPGIRKISPTCGLPRMFRMPSRRLLPGRSGMARCRSSSTRTNPGASPLGETSHWPAALAVATRTNGAWAMKSRQCASRAAICFFSASSLGFPTSARSASSDVTRSRNIELLLSGFGPHVEGVERAREHRVVADGRGQLDETLHAQARAQRGNGGVVGAVIHQQLADVPDDGRLVLREPDRRAPLADGGDGLLPHARLARLANVVRPLEPAVKDARDGEDDELR